MCAKISCTTTNKSVKTDCIVTLAVSFFTHNATLSAKRLSYFELNIQGISHVKGKRNIIDIYKLFISAVKEKKNIPYFVIFNPFETRIFGNAISATVATVAKHDFLKAR